MRKPLAIVICTSALALRLGAGCRDWPGRAQVFDSVIGAVRVADLNHDGRADLIVLDSSGIHVRLGNGDGTFGEDTAYPIANALNATMAAGDLDRDGSTDVVVARTDGTIAVLFGRFDGMLAPPQLVHAAASLGHVAIADVTGDGMPDLVATTADAVVVIPTMPSRAFGPPVSYVSLHEAGELAIGDFNEDGRLDVVTTERKGSMALLLNNGHGFDAPISIGQPTVTTALAVADLNGDGHLDVLASGVDGTLQILLGRGGATFEQASFAFRTWAPSPFVMTVDQIRVSDFDANGKANLIVTINDAGTLRDAVLVGNGDGTFREAIRYSGSAAAIADLDGDHLPDLLDARGPDLAFAHGKGHGLFDAAAPIPIDYQPSIEQGDQHAITAADFDGDGRIDLAVTSDFNRSLTLFPGSSSYVRPAPQPDGDWETRQIEAGDVNGDGIPDLVLSGPIFPDVKRLLLGRKGGGFATPVDFAAGGGESPQFVLADVNGDGSADFVSIADAPAEVAIAISNGNGTFRAPVMVGSRSAAAVPGNVVAADLGGHGTLDLVVVHAIQGSGYELEILPGHGDGTFGASRIISVAASAPLTNPPPVVRVADLNHDGRPDIVFTAVTNTNVAIVFLQQTDGSFHQLVPVTTEASGEDMVVADFGGDGSVDLAFTSEYSDEVTVAYGAGDGTFGLPVHFRVDHGPTRLIALDRGGNQPSDLAVLNTDGHALTILESSCNTRARNVRH